MKTLKRTLAVLIIIYGNLTFSQDDYFALIAKIPGLNYDYPGLIRPIYHNYFIEPSLPHLGLLGKIKKVEYDDGNFYEFNEAGQLKKHHQIFEGVDGSRTTVYTYNEQKKLVEIRSESKGYNEGWRITKFKYLTNGTILKTFISEDDTTTHEITEGQIFNQLGSNSKNSLGLISKAGKTSFEYDGRKRLVKLTSPNGVENRYYNDNNTLSRIEYKGKNKEIFVNFRYDPKGKWIREKSTQSNFGNSRTLIDNLITLEFDDHGNWTTMDIKDNKDSRFSKKYTRIITYY